MKDKKQEILAFTDLHIDKASEMNEDILERYLSSNNTDYLLFLGDILDTVPNKRTEENKEEFTKLFEKTSSKTAKYDVEILTVSGNHDHDLYGLLEEIDNLTDLGNETVETENGLIIGRNETSFDIGPEIRFKEYEEMPDKPEKIEKELLDFYDDNIGLEELQNKLNVLKEEKLRFENELNDYLSELDNLLDRSSNDENILLYASHIAPFNTKLDSKDLPEGYQEHWGSIASKHYIEKKLPKLSVNGHQGYQEFDSVKDDNGSYLLGLEPGPAYKINLNEEEITFNSVSR